MINELEKIFFDTFGIEQKYEDGTCDMDDECRYTDCSVCQRINKFNYPQITNRIYLMLLATLTCISNIEFPFADIQKLKEDILKEVIKHQYGFDKHQVRTLFEEG